MRLINIEKERELWTEKGYQVYSYDRQAVRENTLKNPEWVHFGAGNLFRAYQAVFCDQLLDRGLVNTGIIAVGGRNSENIDNYFRPFDDLHIAVTLKSDGQIEKRVVGSVMESLKMEEMDRLREIFRQKSLKVCTFTITEKGYLVGDDEPDFNTDPSSATSYMGRLASLLFERYNYGGYPLTLSSHDNCSHNGDVLKAAIMKFAQAWQSAGFTEYLEKQVSFPIAMIDKITPRPDKDVKQILWLDGVEDMDGLDPAYYMNCFVNAEQAQYLVIEDDFRNGRLPWDKQGVIYTARDTVDKVEKMKVCTCLNPVHTALAVFGCLLGYTRIWQEMKDEVLVKLVKHVGYDEGLPVVTDPGIINPKEFLDTVINERVTNPFMPDAPQRIATDTSQKIPVRYGETLKAYQQKGADLSHLTYIPLVLAGWLRYLTGWNDEGKRFELSSDPLLEKLCPIMKQFDLKEQVRTEDISQILRDKTLFGVDLIECNLADKIVGYLNEMLSGKGMVRKTLEKYC